MTENEKNVKFIEDEPDYSWMDYESEVDWSSFFVNDGPYPDDDDEGEKEEIESILKAIRKICNEQLYSCIKQSIIEKDKIRDGVEEYFIKYSPKENINNFKEVLNEEMNKICSYIHNNASYGWYYPCLDDEIFDYLSDEEKKAIEDEMIEQEQKLKETFYH